MQQFRIHLPRISSFIAILVAISTVLIGLAAGWYVLMSQSLPCGSKGNGQWGLRYSDVGGNRLQWVFQLSPPESGAKPEFLACLHSTGFRIHYVPHTRIVVAERGREVISNSDGLGNVEDSIFYHW
jgi:hypothetical protein